ncbi:VanR-ABDEGLN family response regulator transcription factor [[Eubacterium] hominis]|uniref:VanR-ABDEGLN family response regulator transcription factor n=1 Tax=[Eubacterium] hominis TaxID=2764325 RepID=UPI003A4D66EC
MLMKLLVVDDEKEIANLVTIYLTNEGYEVDVFYNGEDALQSIQHIEYDLAILDVMLPDVDGFTICRKIRERHTYPIIMLTAKEQDIDKITGLTIGADDYMTKPFQPLELVARVKAQLRRYKRYNHSSPIHNSIRTYSGLYLDQDQHLAKLNEKPLNLTPIEFSILWYLCSRQGKVVNARELYQAIWKEEYLTSSNNTLMVHIRHIREKMKDDAEHPKYIKNVWGVGYKLGG